MLTQYVNMSHQVMSSCVSILCQHIVSICQYVDNIKSCHIVSTYCVKYVNTLTHHVNMSHQVMSCCVNIWCQYIVSICQHVDMMIIAFITFNYSSVPLIEGLCSSNPWESEFLDFRRNRTDDLTVPGFDQLSYVYMWGLNMSICQIKSCHTVSTDNMSICHNSCHVESTNYVNILTQFDSFHWKYGTPKIQQLIHLSFLVISRYKSELWFRLNLNLYRGIWFSGFGGVRGCSIFGGKRHMLICNSKSWHTRELDMSWCVTSSHGVSTNNMSICHIKSRSVSK